MHKILLALLSLTTFAFSQTSPLRPNTSITFPNSITIDASDVSFDGEIEVSVEVSEQWPGDEPYVEPDFELGSPFYTISSSVDVDTYLESFRISIPLPEGEDPATLSPAFFAPEKRSFSDHGEGSIWLPQPYKYDSEANELVFVVNSLFSDGEIFVLRKYPRTQSSEILKLSPNTSVTLPNGVTIDASDTSFQEEIEVSVDVSEKWPADEPYVEPSFRLGSPFYTISSSVDVDTYPENFRVHIPLPKGEDPATLSPAFFAPEKRSFSDHGEGSLWLPKPYNYDPEAKEFIFVTSTLYSDGAIFVLRKHKAFIAPE